MEQAVLFGALFYVAGAWVLSRRDDRRRKQEPPRFEPFEFEAKPSRPFLVWINSLPRLGETPAAPLTSFRGEGFSVHARD